MSGDPESEEEEEELLASFLGLGAFANDPDKELKNVEGGNLLDGNEGLGIESDEDASGHENKCCCCCDCSCNCC